MTLNESTAKKVKDIFESLIQTKKNGLLAGFDWDEYKRYNPFHGRLVDNQEFWKANRVGRSFVTTLGQHTFGKIAKIIAQQSYQEVELDFTVTGFISEGKLATIEQIISDLGARRRQPNWASEINEIDGTPDTGRKLDRGEKADLHIGDFPGGALLTEIKAPLPNKDQSIATKRKMHIWRLITGSPNIYFSFTYCPCDSRATYNHPYALQVFDIKKSPAVIVGEELWNKLGGPGTYQQLLDIAESVGKKISLI